MRRRAGRIWFRAVRRDDTDTAINHEITSHHQCDLSLSSSSHLSRLPHQTPQCTSRLLTVTSPRSRTLTLTFNAGPLNHTTPTFPPAHPLPTRAVNLPRLPLANHLPVRQASLVRRMLCVPLLAALPKTTDLRCLFCFPLAF